MFDLAAQIGSDAFQTADRNRFTIHTFPAAGRFARPIARAPENAREDIGFAVQHVRIGVSALRNEANVLGYVCVGRTRPLTIHNTVEVVRVLNLSRLHTASLRLR